MVLSADPDVMAHLASPEPAETVVPKDPLVSPELVELAVKPDPVVWKVNLEQTVKTEKTAKLADEVPPAPPLLDTDSSSPSTLRTSPSPSAPVVEANSGRDTRSSILKETSAHTAKILALLVLAFEVLAPCLLCSARSTSNAMSLPGMTILTG